LLRALAGQLRELGGVLAGDETSGTFSIRPSSNGRAVRGNYLVVQGALRVQITDRPKWISCRRLEELVRDALKTDGSESFGPIATDFTIEVRFLGGLTPSQQDVFMGAAERWSRIIVGDLPSARLPSGEVVDDIVVNARGAFIDGASGVLGRAGPTVLRPGSMLPVTGMMEFDTADLVRMEMDGTLSNVIVHEMGHVLGFGSLWDPAFFDLVQSAGGLNPLYIGQNGMREFASLLGAAAPRPVPVENTGGPGTAGSHWRESVFLNELMTGFIGGGSNPLSRLTVAALQDMGYTVNFDAAEPYALPTELEVRLQGLQAHLEQCGGPVMRRTRPVILPNEAMKVDSNA
jgi:hypothetical protein